MFFELEGVTFRIKFYRLGKTTIAELFKVEEDGTISSWGVYGIASVFHTDVFEKKIGRKVALSNLLKALSSPEMEAAPLILSKEDRAMIWQKYFETHRK